MFLTSFVSGIKKSQGNITAALGYYIIKISEYENCIVVHPLKKKDYNKCILNITKILLIYFPYDIGLSRNSTVI